MENANSIFSQFPKLETNRCELLQIIEEIHSTDIFNLFKNDSVTQYLEGIESFECLEDAHSFILLFDRAYHEYKSAISWGIRIKESCRMIGIICVYDINNKESAKIFYALLPQFWGIGLMTECLKKVTCFISNQMDIDRIETEVDNNNKRSQSALLKVGYKKNSNDSMYIVTKAI
jgi:ribosomal-protein-alanine N-acetyltransferase